MPKKELRELAPQDELDKLIQEATRSVEDDLALEDRGWINLVGQTGVAITEAERILNLKLSRLYWVKDPLIKHSVRLWTDYTNGKGLIWSVDEENEVTNKVLKTFWETPANQSVLSARGQRKSCDKVLVDGEIFFAIFLGGKNEAPRIRRIDPLEITEIISDPQDIENVRYYRRQWMDPQSKMHIDILRSTTNIKDESVPDFSGAVVKKTEDALVYHLALNTLTQRGNPLMTPALDWTRQFRRFLASRIAIMLALARFAWHTKLKGGQAAVDGIKAKTEGQEINAASILIENMGSDTKPIKTESGAKNAYDDARLIKLQVATTAGFPESYYADISTGNLATAKTVELPVLKMIQSFQAVWLDTYKDINEVILAHAGISPDKWYVDMAYPPIAPTDVTQLAEALQGILQTMPELAALPDVQQQALIALGINDPAEALELLSKVSKENPALEGLRYFKWLREVLEKKNGHEQGSEPLKGAG